jgi:hypothetical protein
MMKIRHVEVVKSCGHDLGRYCDGKEAYIKTRELEALKIYDP